MKMEWLAKNWFIVMAFVAVLTLTIYSVIFFIKEPKETKLKNLKEWLKWAVVQAEKELGSGTGALKLRMVYDMAIQKYPWLINYISFDTFSNWVDEALDWMRKQLETNVNIKLLVNGGEKNGTAINL